MKHTALIVPVVILAVLGLQPAAHADCVSECQASTYCDSTMGSECGRRLNDCYLRECNNRSTISHGAIAYGRSSQAWGYSHGMANAQAADRKALANCRSHGNDCAIVASFSSGCAAVAAGAGPGYAMSLGKTEEAAQAQALKSCRGNGIGSCEIKVWSCVDP